MSKADILAELPKLSPPDRQEIIHRLWDLEEMALLCGGEPSAEEKALLDEALEEYRRNPHAGRPWREVLSRLRASPAS
jgi:putative addiction module component (TIGR02574 family)